MPGLPEAVLADEQKTPGQREQTARREQDEALGKPSGDHEATHDQRTASRRVEAAEVLAELPRATLVEIEVAGHNVHLECPHEVVGAILDFLSAD